MIPQTFEVQTGQHVAAPSSVHTDRVGHVKGAEQLEGALSARAHLCVLEVGAGGWADVVRHFHPGEAQSGSAGSDPVMQCNRKRGTRYQRKSQARGSHGMDGIAIVIARVWMKHMA